MTPSLNCSHSSPQVSGWRGGGGEGKEVVVELFQFYRVNRDNRRLETNVRTCIPFSSSFFFLLGLCIIVPQHCSSLKVFLTIELMWCSIVLV